MINNNYRIWYTIKGRDSSDCFGGCFKTQLRADNKEDAVEKFYKKLAARKDPTPANIITIVKMQHRGWEDI